MLQWAYMADVPTYSEVVLAHNWALYDITPFGDAPVGLPDSRSSWEVLAEIGPVAETREGNTYVCAPNALAGESLRDAVVRQRAMGPYLHVPDYSSPDYTDFELYTSPKHAFFTRIALHAAHIVLHSPQQGFGRTDLLVIPNNIAPGIFARNFGVMTYEESRAIATGRIG